VWVTGVCGGQVYVGDSNRATKAHNGYAWWCTAQPQHTDKCSRKACSCPPSSPPPPLLRSCCWAGSTPSVPSPHPTSPPPPAFLPPRSAAPTLPPPSPEKLLVGRPRMASPHPPQPPPPHLSKDLLLVMATGTPSPLHTAYQAQPSRLQHNAHLNTCPLPPHLRSCWWGDRAWLR
jgi:hypothetical protein